MLVSCVRVFRVGWGGTDIIDTGKDTRASWPPAPRPGKRVLSSRLWRGEWRRGVGWHGWVGVGKGSGLILCVGLFAFQRRRRRRGRPPNQRPIRILPPRARTYTTQHANTHTHHQHRQRHKKEKEEVLVSQPKAQAGRKTHHAVCAFPPLPLVPPHPQAFYAPRPGGSLPRHYHPPSCLCERCPSSRQCQHNEDESSLPSLVA